VTGASCSQSKGLKAHENAMGRRNATYISRQKNGMWDTHVLSMGSFSQDKRHSRRYDDGVFMEGPGEVPARWCLGCFVKLEGTGCKSVANCVLSKRRRWRVDGDGAPGPPRVMPVRAPSRLTDVCHLNHTSTLLLMPLACLVLYPSSCHPSPASPSIRRN